MKITWKITNMTRLASIGEYQDVVTKVVWRCEGEEEGRNELIVYDGEVDLPFDASSKFTSYTNLTEEQVLQWVFDSGVSKAGIESIVMKSMDDCKSSAVISSTPPWGGYHSPLETE